MCARRLHGRSCPLSQRDNGSVVAALTAALADAELGVRIEAAASLCELGPDAQDALPDIIRVLRESAGAWKQRRLVATLGNMGPAAKDAVPVLLDLLRRRRDGLLSFAPKEEVALAMIAPDDPEVARTIVSMLNKMSVAMSTREWAPKMGKSIVPLLLAALDDPDESLRANAVLALVASRHREYPTIKRLVELLDDRCWFVRLEAASALGKIGPAAREAVPALVARLQDRGPLVARAAGAALANIGIDPDDETTKARLRSALVLAEPDVRPSVARTLLQAGDKEHAMQALRDSLASEDTEVRLAATYALHEAGDTATDDLRRAMGDTDGRVRVAAAWSLAKADVHCDEALSIIVQTLTDWNADARRAAASALGRLGARAKIALPTLERTMLRDPVVWVADEAAAAIGKIEPERAPPKTRRRDISFGLF